MTTPDEELKEALDNFKQNWEALIDQFKLGVAAMTAEATRAMKEMRQRLEDAQVAKIIAENPGIDEDEVRASVRRTQDYDYANEGFGGT